MRIQLLCLSALTLLVAGCGQSSGIRTTRETNSEYEMGNPYDEGTGHYAGYEWAERTGEDCNGNSDSFNEGCEEYYRQAEAYENSR